MQGTELIFLGQEATNGDIRTLQAQSSLVGAGRPHGGQRTRTSPYLNAKVL
jgi:hypothetical protein